MADVTTKIEPLTLDRDQAAAALNVPPATLANLTRTDKVRSIMVGKHKRWLLADLQAFVEDQRKNEPCAHAARQ